MKRSNYREHNSLFSQMNILCINLTAILILLVPYLILVLIEYFFKASKIISYSKPVIKVVKEKYTEDSFENKPSPNLKTLPLNSQLTTSSIAQQEFSENKNNIFPQTIIIGIGSGRCGTLAFSRLLNFQPSSEVSHEFHTCKGLEWTYEKSEVFPELAVRFSRNRIKQYISRSLGKRKLLIGDIALWNLPYAEAFLNVDPRVKIVVHACLI